MVVVIVLSAGVWLSSALSARLTEAGRVHCRGDQKRFFGPGRLPLARRWSDESEALPSSAARTRPARTVVRTNLPIRLVDVGDAWRALLFGAPPILL